MVTIIPNMKGVGGILINWNPVAFQVGPLAVRWYGIFMALSFLFGVWYLIRKGTDRGLTRTRSLTSPYWPSWPASRERA